MLFSYQVSDGFQNLKMTNEFFRSLDTNSILLEFIKNIYSISNIVVIVN